MNKYNMFIKKLIESENIQKLYKDYIIKDITFKEWVVGMVDEIHKKEITK